MHSSVVHACGHKAGNVHSRHASWWMRDAVPSQHACVAARRSCRLQMLPLHQPDPAWRFQDFLKQQRQQSQPQQQHCMQQTTSLHSRPLPQQQHQLLPTAASPTPWRELYYLTWSHVMVLYCTACHQHFPARQYSHCSYHPLAPVFASEAGAGQYPCCGRPAWRPGLALAHSQGCCAAQHQAALQLQQPPRRQQQQQQDAPQVLCTQQECCYCFTRCNLCKSLCRKRATRALAAVRATLPFHTVTQPLLSLLCCYRRKDSRMLVCGRCSCYSAWAVSSWSHTCRHHCHRSSLTLHPHLQPLLQQGLGTAAMV